MPGHLPAKMKEYFRKYRSLSTTYLTYSSDGRHLLANLGGDHVYLFDTLGAEVPKQFIKETDASRSNEGIDCFFVFGIANYFLLKACFCFCSNFEIIPISHLNSIVKSLKL